MSVSPLNSLLFVFLSKQIKGKLSVRKTALMSFRDDFLRPLSPLREYKRHICPKTNNKILMLNNNYVWTIDPITFYALEIIQEGLKADDEVVKNLRHMLLVLLVSVLKEVLKEENAVFKERIFISRTSWYYARCLNTQGCRLHMHSLHRHYLMVH